MASHLITRIADSGVLERKDILVRSSNKALVSILDRSEKRTIAWVTRSLSTPRGFYLIRGFKLPLIPLIRVEYLRFYRASYQMGRRDVADSLGGDFAYEFTIGTSNRLRAKSFLAADRLTSKLEGDLKRDWSKNMTRKIDLDLLVYFTKLNFSNMTGKAPPNGV